MNLIFLSKGMDFMAKVNLVHKSTAVGQDHTATINPIWLILRMAYSYYTSSSMDRMARLPVSTQDLYAALAANPVRLRKSGSRS